MDDFALTPAERALLQALNRRGVSFIIIGMGAAVLQGAPVATQDLDLWFARADDESIRLAHMDSMRSPSNMPKRSNAKSRV